MSAQDYDEGVLHMLDLYKAEYNRFSPKVPDDHPHLVYLKARIKELNREIRIFK